MKKFQTNNRIPQMSIMKNTPIVLTRYVRTLKEAKLKVPGLYQKKIVLCLVRMMVGR